MCHAFTVFELTVSSRICARSWMQILLEDEKSTIDVKEKSRTLRDAVRCSRRQLAETNDQ